MFDAFVFDITGPNKEFKHKILYTTLTVSCLISNYIFQLHDKFMECNHKITESLSSMVQTLYQTWKV